jgi:DNA-binding SARP family transcriptional activator
MSCAPPRALVRETRVSTPGTITNSRWRYVSKTLPKAVAVTERTRIQLCGRLSVEIAGAQVVDDLRGRQVRLLLAYLILHRTRQIGREELSAALWPFSAPQSQDAALRTLLSRLRSAVGPSVLTGREYLGLALPEPVWIDLEAAGAGVARAREALEAGDFRSAWALAQVPLNISGRGLLPGVEASWLESSRRDLEELRLETLDVIGRAGLGMGGSQIASAERAARALIAAEPYRESAYTLMMEALAVQGNIAEGLRVFDRLRTLLREELGTLPSPQALAMHDALLHPQARGGVAVGAVGDDTRGPIELPSELDARGRAKLVGREAELATLQGLWEQATAEDSATGNRGPSPGQARVVVLAGDPGVGKTRLAAELARRVHAAGAVVLAGRSPEESLLPYQPFLEALRHYVVHAPLEELRRTAREYGAELARLVPELRRRAPELITEVPVDPDTERYRLFEAAVGLLGAISRKAPILLVLDDLQWADRPALLLLRHLARALDPRRLLILVAYRAIETPAHGTSSVLADLRREQLVTELGIGGLSAQETAELVRVRTGETPAPAFARALHEETEGNPLFIEEMVRHLGEAGVRAVNAEPSDLQRFGLPEGVKQVIARRLDRLDSAATEWLRTAAVIGRDFDADLLERVLGWGEIEFLDVLDQALDAGLVAETAPAPGRYSFDHALIREALYEGMSSPRRARMHRHVGEVLEATGGEPEIAALALHFTRAAGSEDADKAIAYAQAAGERATAMLAHEEAAEHYARALEVLHRFGGDEDRRRGDLLLLEGDALVRAGEPERAWHAFSSAAALGERVGDSETVARAAAAASRRYLQQPGVVDIALIALLERALQLTQGQRTVMRVLLLARLCGALYFSPSRGRMTELAQEAAQIAQQLGDPEAEVYACAARRRALWHPAHLDERLRASTQMLTMARATGSLEAQLQAHVWLVVDLLEQGEVEAVDAQIEAFTSGAARLRQPVFVWHAIVWKAMRAMLSGRLAEAETLAGEALSAGHSAESVAAPQYYAVQLLGVRLEQGRMPELEAPLRSFVAANPTRPAWRAALADLLIHADQPEEARALLDALASEGFADIPQDGDWMTAITLLSDVVTALEDAPRAAQLYELLFPYRRQNVVIGLAAACLGSSCRYLGRLAATAGRAQEASRLFERALDANAKLGAAVELAHTQLDYAQLVGPGARARGLVDAAARTAAALDLPRVALRAQSLRRA